MQDESLFAHLGGRPVLERVHKIFYDKLYAHPWLKHFFKGVDQKGIESQQTDFMISNMGGGKIYSGQLVGSAHKQMFITQEIFDLRHRLLRESLAEAGIREDLAERWLKIDRTFAAMVVKTDPSQCIKRFFTDEIINVPKPPGF